MFALDTAIKEENRGAKPGPHRRVLDIYDLAVHFDG